jgi:hypothetical protein
MSWGVHTPCSSSLRLIPNAPASVAKVPKARLDHPGRYPAYETLIPVTAASSRCVHSRSRLSCA